MTQEFFVKGIFINILNFHANHFFKVKTSCKNLNNKKEKPLKTHKYICKLPIANKNLAKNLAYLFHISWSFVFC